MANQYKDLSHTAEQIDSTIDGFSAHAADTVSHVTLLDRESWNAKAEAADLAAKADQTDLTAEVQAREDADSALQDDIGAVANAGAKNLLPITVETTTTNGVTFTVDKDAGTITVSADGTQTTNTFFYLVRNDDDFRSKIIGKKIVLSGCPSGGSGSTYRLRCWHYDGNSIASDLGDGASFTFTNTSENYDVSIQIFAGAVCDNIVFKPMIRDAKISDSTFTPYAPTNRELYEMILALQSNS